MSKSKQKQKFVKSKRCNGVNFVCNLNGGKICLFDGCFRFINEEISGRETFSLHQINMSLNHEYFVVIHSIFQGWPHRRKRAESKIKSCFDLNHKPVKLTLTICQGIKKKTKEKKILIASIRTAEPEKLELTSTYFWTLLCGLLVIKFSDNLLVLGLYTLSRFHDTYISNLSLIQIFMVFTGLTFWKNFVSNCLRMTIPSENE